MFKQVKVPYDYKEFETCIDEETFEYHYGKHHAAYTANLNALYEKSNLSAKESSAVPIADPIPRTIPICSLLESLDNISDAVLRKGLKDNGGGFYNHNMYFEEISPHGSRRPSGKLERAITECFGSFEAFKEEISALAMSQFGSGWAWMSVKGEGKLELSKSSNQNNPITCGTGLVPIFNIDVWEHAYYIVYRNRRADYIRDFFEIVDWSVVERRYEKALEIISSRECCEGGEIKGEECSFGRKYKGTKTEKNLLEAFAAESKARNKYTYFSSAAKKAGFEQIAAIFEQTANNEREHAEIWFKELGLLSDTADNLEQAAEGEYAEWSDMYARMAADAEEEGFFELSEKFRGVLEVERLHENCYRKLLENVEMKQVFEKTGITVWECRNCGHLVVGRAAPEICPVCSHPKAYYQVRVEYI